MSVLIDWLTYFGLGFMAVVLVFCLVATLSGFTKLDGQR